MAKKRAKKRAGKKRAGKKRSLVEWKTTVAKRAAMHKAATELADFHGGKLPVRSGCGRPRTKKRR